MSNAVEEVLAQIPMDQLAAELGTDPASAEQAARAAIPTLIGGLEHNATEGGQEQPIAQALADHQASSLLDGGQVSLDQVDTEDGSKIVRHIFGPQSDQMAYALGSRSGSDSSLVSKLLPYLAPIVLAYLAKKITGQQQSRQHDTGGAGQGGAADGGILGQILGGGAGGGLLGGILGQILGGGHGGAAAQPRAEQPVQRPSTPAQNGGPFRTPDVDAAAGGDGELRMDPGTDDAVQGQQASEQRQTQAGPFDSILDKVFGRH